MGEGGGDETVKALVEQIGRLNPEQLDKVRKAVLFGSNANLKDLDRSAFIMNRPSSPRGRREASPKGRREASPKERTPVNRLGPEDYGYLPNQDSTSSLVSNNKDKAGFKRTSSATDHPIDILLREKGRNMSRYLVVVSSLSLDWKELVKIPGVAGYELRMLWHLYFLRARKMHVVMCTSQYIPEELIKYYLSYLPGDISVEDARSRLTLVCCNDMTARSVTEKLLTRPRTLQRIKNCIESDKAAMTCFNSTDAEVELAKSLDIPLFGTDTQGAFWGTKTGNRQVFLDAGVDHPDGSYREIFTEEELCEEILALLKRCPFARKIMVKLNDSFSGEGNTVLRVDETLQEALKDSDQKAKMVITEKLHNSLEFVAPGLTWARYYTQFQNLGGICEVFVEGAAEAKTSPSCQAFLNNNGDVRILATHEQMLNNQIYFGCKFPANEEYAKDIVTMTMKIGEELSKRDVIGYIAVDFVSVRQEDGTYKHWAIEVNVRMGGTTLPIMTLNLLCQDGVFNAGTSEFIASDGYPRYYIASDTLRKPSYKGLLIEDLLAIIKRHSTEIEWNERPGAPETGVIFHLVTLLSELGKCGVICVGRSRDEAEELFQRVKEILDQECEVGEAEMSLVIEGDGADMLIFVYHNEGYLVQLDMFLANKNVQLQVGEAEMSLVIEGDGADMLS